MMIKSFNELVIEEKEDNKNPYRLVVLAEKPKKSNPKATSAKIVKLATKLGHEVYDCRINGAFIMRDDKTGQLTIHKEDDSFGFEIDEDTIVLIRGAVGKKDSYLDLISQLERYGIPVCNFRETIEVCGDKFRCYLRLQEIGMNQPKTVLIPNAEKESVETAHEALKSKFPMVLKTLQGSKGVGVLLIETERSLQSTVQLVYKIDPYADILLQEYIEVDFDVRCIVVNKEIIGAMKRPKILDDFRSNVSQGSEPEEIKLTEVEQEAVLQAAKAVNGQWVGVDFMPAKNRDKDAPFIIEVNHSPGTEGINKVIKGDVNKIVLENLLDRDSWKRSATECGVLETLEVEGQELTVKMDTGNNTTTCALHADDLTVKNKVVSWTTEGVKYKEPLHRYVELLKPAEKRPVVLLEINFLNTVYEVEVSLDKRNQIPFLANRDFMKRANLMINPARKFMLTNKNDEHENG